MKKILVLIVIFAGLAAFVYYYEIKGDEKREAAEKAKKSLFDLKQEDITSVAILERGQEPIVLKKEGENWVLKRPVETSADSTTVDSLLRNIETANIERTFPAGAKQADVYGLEEPRLTLKIQSKGQEKVLQIGNDDYTGNYVYVKFAPSPEVYVTSDYVYTTADKELQDWRNKKILAFQRDKVQTVEISRPAEKIRLKKEGEKWMLESPIREQADDGAVSSVLSTLEFADAQKFVAEQPDDLKRYGLDQPEVFIRFQEQGQDQWKTLQLGKKENENYPARNPDRSPVFTVKQEVYDKLTQKLWEFRNKDVVDVDQDRVAQLAIRRGNEEIVIKHQDTRWMVERPQAQKGKEALTYKFWYPIDDIKFESINEKAAEFPKPDVEVILTLKDGSKRTFAFAKQGDRYLAVKKDSGRQGSISKESFEKLQIKPEEIV